MYHFNPLVGCGLLRLSTRLEIVSCVSVMRLTAHSLLKDQKLFTGSKMMFESIDGVILNSWDKEKKVFYIDGAEQTKKNGFQSHWEGYKEIECMLSIADLHFDPDCKY